MSKETKEVKRERERCLKLVKAYREHIEHVLDNPRWYGSKESWRDVSAKIAEALRDIEVKINSPEAAQGSDFSIEELEQAEKIMAEQNSNPFEG